MKVKNLIKELKKYNTNAEVFLPGKVFENSTCNQVKSLDDSDKIKTTTKIKLS